MDLTDFFTRLPVQFLYVIIAITGGIARYLNSYADGKVHFSTSIFLASGFMAGFSGMMFALVGDSLHLPYPMAHIMAGVGGFFGEQTMKLVLEYVASRSSNKTTQT